MSVPCSEACAQVFPNVKVPASQTKDSFSPCAMAGLAVKPHKGQSLTAAAFSLPCNYCFYRWLCLLNHIMADVSHYMVKASFGLLRYPATSIVIDYVSL